MEACDTLMRNFEQEFASVSSNKGTSGHSLHQKMDIVFHSDEESSLGDSSLNQVMLDECKLSVLTQSRSSLNLPWVSETTPELFGQINCITPR